VVGIALKPSSGPLLPIVPPLLAQPGSSGASTPVASAANPPWIHTRRAGSATLWMSAFALRFESSIVSKSLATSAPAVLV
jgi:hypothetical protein